MANPVPDRANASKRKLKNMVATSNSGRFTGEATIHVVDSTDPDDRGKYYSGYSKSGAKKRHKEYLEGK